MKPGIYFPGLNGIRFLAALSVLFIHVEQFKDWFGIRPRASPFILSQIVLNGFDSVTLFFVLSGFLITYLLLAEHDQFGTINVRAFYIRRALRIWPLYYLLVFMGFIAVPLLVRLTGFTGYAPISDLPGKFTAFMLMTPHLILFTDNGVPPISHLWTIGVEEHFYLLWPLIVRRWVHRLPLALLILVAGKVGNSLLYFALLPNPAVPVWLKETSRFIMFFRVENMAIGGLGAYVLFTQQERWLRLLFHPITEKLALLLMLGNIFVFRSDNDYLSTVALCGLYTVFILNVAANPRATLKLEHRLLDALGRCAYGIYMYHPVVMYLVLMTAHLLRRRQDNGDLYNWLLYGICTSLTLLIAYVSYQRFELPFLRLKERFSTVANRDQMPAPQLT
jgi:peptidoglycan/LPS O-acetylase OafA/YrhL